MDSCYMKANLFSVLSLQLSVCVCVWLNTTHISFHICSCYRYSEEERGYWMAVDVLLQHRTHVSVCAPLSPACRAGFYKSGLGNVECSKCPPHSFSHYEGSLHCGCEKNYFRAEGDPASMACTREYTCHWRSVFVCRFKELSDDSGSSLTWTDPSHIWQEKPSSESRELWEDFFTHYPKKHARKPCLIRFAPNTYRCFRFHPRSLCVLANLITQNTVDGKYIKWKHCLSAAELWILRAGKKKYIYIYMVWASMAV